MQGLRARGTVPMPWRRYYASLTGFFGVPGACMSDLSLALSLTAAALGVVALVIAMRHLSELKTTHDETHTLRRETLQALGLHEILVE